VKKKEIPGCERKSRYDAAGPEEDALLTMRETENGKGENLRNVCAGKYREKNIT